MEIDLNCLYAQSLIKSMIISYKQWKLLKVIEILKIPKVEHKCFELDYYYCQSTEFQIISIQSCNWNYWVGIWSNYKESIERWTTVTGLWDLYLSLSLHADFRICFIPGIKRGISDSRTIKWYIKLATNQFSRFSFSTQ